jgi:hypothetical protein
MGQSPMALLADAPATPAGSQWNRVDRTMGRIILRVLLLGSLLAGAIAGAKDRLWQPAEIVSIKQDELADGRGVAFVYSFRTRNLTYVAVYAAPLKAYIHCTVQVSVDRKNLCVHDLDGKARSAQIVEQRENAARR